MDVYEKSLREAERAHPANRKRRARITAIIIALTVFVGGVGAAGATWWISSHSSANPQSSSEALTSLIKTGINQASNGQMDIATGTFKNVLEIDPENVLANYNLGVIAQSQDRTQDALTYYNAALQANVSFTPAMYNKAILIESTDPKAAIALYQQIVQLNPKASTSYLRLSQLYESEGEVEKAEQAKAKALEIDPSLAAG